MSTSKPTILANNNVVFKSGIKVPAGRVYPCETAWAIILLPAVTGRAHLPTLSM